MDPVRIACRFAENILDRVAAAIGRYVTVYRYDDYDWLRSFARPLDSRSVLLDAV